MDHAAVTVTIDAGHQPSGGPNRVPGDENSASSRPNALAPRGSKSSRQPTPSHLRTFP
jgi:hypothetical protein